CFPGRVSHAPRERVPEVGTRIPIGGVNMAESSPRQVSGSSILDNRWLILLFSILSMVAVANFQYGWTLFVPPLQKHLNVDQAAGFGAGSAFTVAPIANLINSAGYQTAFIQWGIIQGAVVVFASLFLKAPPAGWLPRGWTATTAATEIKRRQSAMDFTSGQMA